MRQNLRVLSPWTLTALAALYFHGGNFVCGSKELLGKFHIQQLIDFGFVVVSVNYRLCPTISLFDGPVTDALDAYAWARTTLLARLREDHDIKVDGDRIVALGHSCGGTLALLLVRCIDN